MVAPSGAIKTVPFTRSPIDTVSPIECIHHFIYRVITVYNNTSTFALNKVQFRHSTMMWTRQGTALEIPATYCCQESPPCDWLLSFLLSQCNPSTQTGGPLSKSDLPFSHSCYFVGEGDFLLWPMHFWKFWIYRQWNFCRQWMITNSSKDKVWELQAWHDQDSVERIAVTIFHLTCRKPLFIAWWQKLCADIQKPECVPHKQSSQSLSSIAGLKVP